jgi:hypothetical protein
MTLWQRVLAWFTSSPSTPHLRIRVVCEFCGKNVAVIASTVRMWKHQCVDYGPGPSPTDPHDRIEELERDDDAA